MKFIFIKYWFTFLFYVKIFEQNARLTYVLYFDFMSITTAQK